eukprot:TRINITY_DN25579_c0_g1_i1.p1 TRINITY_DN25579_c0_g1~~TRINITY_DN25579_c0_g1_i1.p1  ORF type:complete len:280 (+),score=56.05 TRINITY_DN25579_c0_g1_i1:61-900(+)
MRAPLLLLASWSVWGDTVDCEAEPQALGCGLVQSSPVVMLFYDVHGCSAWPVANATYAERTYSSRRIYDTSNEPSLCYSVSGAIGLHGQVRSVRWSCERNGAILLQTPFFSNNCSGEEVLDAAGNPQRMIWNSGLWSQVLDGTVCLSQAARTHAGRSIRLAGSMGANVRPLCVQSLQTMENEIVALTSDQTSQDAALKQSEARFRSRLHDVELAQRLETAGRAHDRKLFFVMGMASGVFLTLVCSVALWTRRARRGDPSQELAMIDSRSEGAYAEIAES